MFHLFSFPAFCLFFNITIRCRKSLRAVHVVVIRDVLLLELVVAVVVLLKKNTDNKMSNAVHNFKQANPT